MQHLIVPISTTPLYSVFTMNSPKTLHQQCAPRMVIFDPPFNAEGLQMFQDNLTVCAIYDHWDAMKKTKNMKFDPISLRWVKYPSDSESDSDETSEGSGDNSENSNDMEVENETMKNIVEDVEMEQESGNDSPTSSSSSSSDSETQCETPQTPANCYVPEPTTSIYEDISMTA